MKTGTKVLWGIVAALVIYFVGAFVNSANRDAAKDAKTEHAMLTGHPPNPSDYPDTSLVHWQLIADGGDNDGEYGVYLYNNDYCNKVYYDVAKPDEQQGAAYVVDDPVATALKQSSSEIMHYFQDLNDARKYLWKRCEAMALADMAARANLAPGEEFAPSSEPAQAPQGSSPAPVQETNPSAVGSGADTILRSDAAQQPALVPVENSNPPAVQPTVQQETTPAPLENPKLAASPPNTVEIEEQAVELWNERRYSEAAPFLEQACNNNRAYTCYYLGSMYNLGQGVAKDTEKGKQLLSRACSLGYERACDGIK